MSTITKRCPACLKFISDDQKYCKVCETKIAKKREGKRMRDALANKEISDRVSRSLAGKYGEESRRWLGEGASYSAKHCWTLKHYGKAKQCEHCHTLTASRYEWANISGRYLRKRDDYIELCPSCHRLMDLRKSNTCRHGHLFTEENTYIDTRGFRQCRTCRKEASRRAENAKRNFI